VHQNEDSPPRRASVQRQQAAQLGEKKQKACCPDYCPESPQANPATMCSPSCLSHGLCGFQVKATELASVQRLEAAELRKQEEKARRLEQARARATAETHLREKVAAATFARGYIKGNDNSSNNNSINVDNNHNHNGYDHKHSKITMTLTLITITIRTMR